MSEKLKPCPLCGGKVAWVSGAICCRRCGLELHHLTHSYELNIKTWNTRTPEQAIAATLGSGKLTAEQVRDAVKRCATFDYGEIGEYVSRENWQAITDELNAALGDDGYKQAAAYWQRMYEELLTERIGEECEIVGHYEASTRGEVGRERVKLSCGHIVERHSKYCQECGRKIRKAVER